MRLTHKKMEWELAINNITNQRTYDYLLEKVVPYDYTTDDVVGDIDYRYD